MHDIVVPDRMRVYRKKMHACRHACMYIAVHDRMRYYRNKVYMHAHLL
jgi:hypothetical protein